MQGCRFITSRTSMDFEVANYMLSKENLDHELPIQNVCMLPHVVCESIIIFRI